MLKTNNLNEKIELCEEKSWIVSTISKSDILDNVATQDMFKDLTDNDMQFIAKELSDLMMYEFWSCLEVACNKLIDSRG